jgi:hypothetical protein
VAVFHDPHVVKDFGRGRAHVVEVHVRRVVHLSTKRQQRTRVEKEEPLKLDMKQEEKRERQHAVAQRCSVLLLFKPSPTQLAHTLIHRTSTNPAPK